MRLDGDRARPEWTWVPELGGGVWGPGGVVKCQPVKATGTFAAPAVEDTGPMIAAGGAVAKMTDGILSFVNVVDMNAC
jgi:hypothetical protein